MLHRSSVALAALAATSLLVQGLAAQTPADTYFSLAVTENSHNHSGAGLLFLDFQEAPFSVPDPALGEIASVEVAPGTVVLDGDDADWDATYLTTVRGLVQNNFPLSEFIDSVGTDITVGSAWDATHVYFLVQWEDAGHDASTRSKKWTFGDQGGGESGWNQQVNVGSTPGAPNASAANATGHVLAGVESEDRIFFMFPVVDSEANFTSGGPGCNLYCHVDLGADDPLQNYTGDGVSAMHTNLPGDVADIWHWKGTRTEPSGFADDKWIEFATGTDNGRRSDSGSKAYSDNNLVGGNPEWMHMSGLGFTGDALFDFESVLFGGVPAAGNELPRYRSVAPSGSRGDVETSASFDAGTNTWTVEFRRLRNTGEPDDHSFEGAASSSPIDMIVTAVDTITGEALYVTHCEGCHDVQGAGFAAGDFWFTPRVQRTSGGHILRAIIDTPPMFGLSILTTQEREDIAAYLQGQSIWEPEPFFVSPTPCGETLQAIAGAPFSFMLAAEDVDVAQDVTLTADGVPAGASFVPTAPGNPTSATFAWTPTNGDLGLHVIATTATDSNGFSTVCEVTVEVIAECYLVLASGWGSEDFPGGSHTWTTQLSGIYEHHGVLLNELALIPLPDMHNLQTEALGTSGGAGGGMRNLRARARRVAPLASFTAQILMWNPDVFPANPEQWSQGLQITVWPDGRVTTSNFGSSDGMTVTHEIFTDAAGKRWLRFPFSILGL